jgi:hypothetical protein
MDTPHICPECGAQHFNGTTCQDDFYQMLFWEAEDSRLGEVHYLMVLCYHLQHPSLYAPEGLTYALGLLTDFVERGLSPAQVHQRSRAALDSGTRKWKVTATASSKGAYDCPIDWTMTAADVVAAGMSNYCDSVRKWAASVHESLKSVSFA